jgi:nucleoside-diphosphate-sugar epimerase
VRASAKPLVVITGAAGDIGTSLGRVLASAYTVIGLDRQSSRAYETINCDLTSDKSIHDALGTLRERHGEQIAAVVHLAAYFDFTGKDNPLYREVNVEGTRRLLRALREFRVDRFIYSGTMLVHRAGQAGERIDESTPIEPGWAYPRSKAETELAIHEEHGDIPYLILRLAGLYDSQTCVPTLANQIARIFERDLQSHLYAGETSAGQSFIHRDDMMDVFRRAIDRRKDLPSEIAILAGEPEAVSFEELQRMVGQLIHGEEEWATFSVPHAIAKAGAWLQEKAEPVVPDTLDRGQPPFVRSFMVEMAQDHYALDITLARKLLGWAPQRDIRRTLPQIVAALKRDPIAWYKANRVTMPPGMESAQAAGANPYVLRALYGHSYRRTHYQYVWTAFANLALASWLITAPALLGYRPGALARSDLASGVALFIFAALSMSWRADWARWICAVIGCWLLSAPLLFWAETAAAYSTDTLLGMLVIAFAVLLPPTPSISEAAAQLGPTVPREWSYSPSGWVQRLPVIVLAFVGLHISRDLAAYQLGHIDSIWDPFFAGTSDPKNGTEEIITSSVSQAWPVSDAGLGAMTYALEILTGAIGSARRWRTMPWLVMLFGLMIVPLGAVSLIFIIIQPIVIGTWCTLCLIAAAAMLVQIPYSLDELVATGQFLYRRKRAGQSLLRVFMVGDTDEEGGENESRRSEFERAPREVVRDALTGGVGAPWNLIASMLIGIWLMCTRLTLGAEGSMANADHLIGALVVTVSVIALAEVGRAVRFVNVALGAALLLTPVVYDVGGVQILASALCGVALILLSLRRGPVRNFYGSWSRYIR